MAIKEIIDSTNITTVQKLANIATAILQRREPVPLEPDLALTLLRFVLHAEAVPANPAAHQGAQYFARGTAPYEQVYSIMVFALQNSNANDLWNIMVQQETEAVAAHGGIRQESDKLKARRMLESIARSKNPLSVNMLRGFFEKFTDPKKRQLLLSMTPFFVTTNYDCYCSDKLIAFLQNIPTTPEDHQRVRPFLNRGLWNSNDNCLRGNEPLFQFFKDKLDDDPEARAAKSAAFDIIARNQLYKESLSESSMTDSAEVSNYLNQNLMIPRYDTQFNAGGGTEEQKLRAVEVRMKRAILKQNSGSQPTHSI